MGQYFVPPELLDTLKDIKTRIQALANSQATPVYTVATLPAASKFGPGTIVHVTNAVPGSQFQGSTGSAWVPLG